jgi:hypothetical protein
MFMVFNATFNNISVILWWSVLLVEETGVPGENHQSVASHKQLSSVEKWFQCDIFSSTQRILTQNNGGDWFGVL